MSLQRDTETLLTEFAKNPGAENFRFEVKSKEVLQTTGQKKKIIRILAAMANKAGGTMIIGVRHQEEDLLYQSFSQNSEPRQELTHIAQQYTSPMIQDLWDISFEECLGHQILRIDIEKAQERLIQFNHKGEYQVWIRDEDGMREMATGEMDQFYQRRDSREDPFPNTSVERSEHISFTPNSSSDDSNPNLFAKRGLLRTDDTYTAVFGSGFFHDYLGKSHTVRLRTRFPGRDGYADIPDVLDTAEEYLGARIGRRFGYSIRVADLHLVGRTKKSLQTDLNRLEKVYNRLDTASESKWSYGPVIAGVVPIDHGLLWFELQREAEIFVRSNFELILRDIPFDEGPLKKFYSEMGISPPVYDQRCGLQFLTLRGNQVEPLQNPTITHQTESELPGYLYITTDNPFSNWSQSIEPEVERPIPDHLMEGLESIDRIPFSVSGGYLSDRDDRFGLNYLHCTQVSGTHPTLLVDSSCRQI